MTVTLTGAATDADFTAADVSQAVADAATDVTYTEPALGDDMLRQYRLIHDEISSDFDVSDINARLMTLQLRDAVYFEEVSDEQDISAVDAVEDPAPANSRPQ